VTRASRDAGETLIEIVISIAIMGIAFVALMGGMLTAVSMSTLHRQQADAQLQLVSALEQVKSAPYVDCAINTTYPRPAGVTNEIVEYWNGIDFGTTCYDASVTYYSTQRITVTVKSDDGRVTRSETILKRRG
jgi:type II secretory pathway pseudopilin PulG